MQISDERLEECHKEYERLMDLIKSVLPTDIHNELFTRKSIIVAWKNGSPVYANPKNSIKWININSFPATENLWDFEKYRYAVSFSGSQITLDNCGKFMSGFSSKRDSDVIRRTIAP